jgi:hypothetical protein
MGDFKLMLPARRLTRRLTHPNSRRGPSDDPRLELRPELTFSRRANEAACSSSSCVVGEKKISLSACARQLPKQNLLKAKPQASSHATL